jgi:hypothetical protein
MDSGIHGARFSVNRDIEAMDGSASPLKPSVAIALRSSAVCNLLVA